MSDYAPISTEIMQRQVDNPILRPSSAPTAEAEQRAQDLLNIVRKSRQQRGEVQNPEAKAMASMQGGENVPLDPTAGMPDTRNVSAGVDELMAPRTQNFYNMPALKAQNEAKQMAAVIPEKPALDTSQPVSPEYSPTANVPPYEMETLAEPAKVAQSPTPPIIPPASAPSAPLGPMGAGGSETSPIIPVPRAAASQAGPTPAEAGAAVAQGETTGAIPKELSFAEKLWKVAPILARGIGEMIQGYHAGLARSNQPPQYQLRQQREYEAGQQTKQFQQQMKLTELENRYAQGLAEIKNRYDQARYLAEQKFQKSRDEIQFRNDMTKAQYDAGVQHDLLDKRITGEKEVAGIGFNRAIGMRGLTLGDIVTPIIGGRP